MFVIFLSCVSGRILLPVKYSAGRGDAKKGKRVKPLYSQRQETPSFIVVEGSNVH